MPLGALGFWRVILDEAQLVSKETSKAATICSEIWRRHAWIATGTPINAKASHVFSLQLLTRFGRFTTTTYTEATTTCTGASLSDSHAPVTSPASSLPPEPTASSNFSGG